MNIEGLTQLEIEEAFDSTNARDMLTAEMEIFFNGMDIKYSLMMESILNTTNDDDITDVFIYILALIGNDKIGVKVGYDRNNKECNVNSKFCTKISNKRDIEAYNIIKALSSSPTILKLSNNPLMAFDLSMDIVAQFDGILFDMHKKTITTIDNQWTTLTYCRSEITFREEVSLMAQYNQFRLPMIETPDDWTETKRGGYKLNKRKVTTNRGEGEQPQAVLDVLNKLQRQSYILVDDVSCDEEKKYLIDKFISKRDTKDKAIEKSEMVTLTTQATYDALRGKKIYFEWRYDCRGRSYTTGYDAHLQSNSYKKGALIPC